MDVSSQFERFRYSCFDNSYGASRDGLDVEAALSLSDSERTEAEALVLNVLPHTNDSRPFTAAGIMKISAASPILKARMNSGFSPEYDYLRVEAAHALYLIEKWGDAPALIVDILKNTPKTRSQQWTRTLAVWALWDFADEPLCHAALFETVEDDDNFIGFLAIDALEKIYSHNATVCALLVKLSNTQVAPHRWKPEYLQSRRQLFLELQSITSIKMPAIAMEKRVGWQ